MKFSAFVLLVLEQSGVKTEQCSQPNEHHPNQNAERQVTYVSQQRHFGKNVDNIDIGNIVYPIIGVGCR